MKSTALCTLLVIGLAACGNQPAPTTSAPADERPARPAAAAAAPARPVAKKALESPLPAGVQLGFDYHLRSDRIETRRSGKAQRLVVVESLAANMGDAMRALKASMKAADFVLLPVAADAPRAEGGARTLTFRKKDFGLVTVVVTPKGARTLRQPNAVATVAFTFDQPEAPAAAAATPAAGG